jgi:hypothetical protein
MSTNSHIRSFPIVVLLYLLPHPLSSGACRCLRPPPYSTAPSYNNRSATAMKRKFDIESDDSLPTVCAFARSWARPIRLTYPLYQNAKQLKLIPFPNCEPDNDAVMSEAEPFDPELHHTRIPSNVSSTSSCASDSPTLSSRTYCLHVSPVPLTDFLWRQQRPTPLLTSTLFLSSTTKGRLTPIPTLSPTMPLNPPPPKMSVYSNQPALFPTMGRFPSHCFRLLIRAYCFYLQLYPLFVTHCLNL